MTNLTQILQKSFSVPTRGRSTIEISREISEIVDQSAVNTGLCHVYLSHTSASLIISENADIDVQKDLETFMSRLVRDGDPAFIHTSEGDDDMPAHIRAVLTQTELTIPVSQGKLALGTWQGVFLWEHRMAPHTRHVTLTLIGH
ncbi:MAG: secondary thiamine-phosphate synthase enzyme YjbQ [Pseudomonadota bacterium]